MEPSKERREKILDIVSQIRKKEREQRITERRESDPPKGKEAEDKNDKVNVDKTSEIVYICIKLKCKNFPYLPQCMT